MSLLACKQNPAHTRMRSPKNCCIKHAHSHARTLQHTHEHTRTRTHTCLVIVLARQFARVRVVAIRRYPWVCNHDGLQMEPAVVDHRGMQA